MISSFTLPCLVAVAAAAITAPPVSLSSLERQMLQGLPLLEQRQPPKPKPFVISSLLPWPVCGDVPDRSSTSSYTISTMDMCPWIDQTFDSWCLLRPKLLNPGQGRRDCCELAWFSSQIDHFPINNGLQTVAKQASFAPQLHRSTSKSRTCAKRYSMAGTNVSHSRFLLPPPG